jgi:hypothetical protein
MHAKKHNHELEYLEKDQLSGTKFDKLKWTMVIRASITLLKSKTVSEGLKILLT